MHTENEITYRIKSLTEREVRFCINYLINSGVIPRLHTPSGNLNRDKVTITNSIKAYIDNPTKNTASYNITNYTDELLSTCHSYLLNENDLSYFLTSHRACYFLWLNVRNLTGNEFKSIKEYATKTRRTSVLYTELEDQVNIYDSLRIEAHPFNHESRYSAIVSFFDRWERTVSDKKIYLDNIRQRWICIFSLKDPLLWINKKDKEQCRWAWDYLYPKLNVTHITPSSESDLYDCLYAIFDYVLNNPDSKNLLSLKISQAWKQRKYRESLVEKKPLNTYLDASVKTKLDIMAKEKGKKINEMLTELINISYDKFGRGEL
ncbi:TPA: hypothetical protein ACF2D8_005067 [Serratia marcescens]